MSAADTIFALSSGPGMAGVAVIRISGPLAGIALERLCGGGLPPVRKLVKRRVRHPRTGEVLDEALMVWMPGPASYTGEDSAELHLHGSPAVIAETLAVLGEITGLRGAEPGEFTRRAFRDGRLDLVEAEGVADLIRARTSAQRRQALQHMLGGASQHYEGWRSELVTCLARVEAAVDFSEEDDVERAALRGTRERLAGLLASIAEAIAKSRQGSAIRDGVKVVFAGPPNTGKSSLLNRLARREAAIVSARAGTTRDVIEVPLDLGGIPVILTDTAGLHAGSHDEIEMVGMARTRNELTGADLVIWVASPDIDDSGVPHNLDSDTIRIENKCDLPLESRLNRNESHRGRYYRMSAVTGEGVEPFIADLTDRVRRAYGQGEPAIVVRERHVQALQRCVESIAKAIDSPVERIEVVAENLRSAATELGRITGRIDVEDLLDSIFRDFCIGK